MITSFGLFFSGGDGGNRSAHFCARQHAAPKNSPPDCFLNGCFDYIPQQKYKSTTRVLLIFGGDEDDKSETVLSSDNVRLLALSLKLK